MDTEKSTALATDLIRVLADSLENPRQFHINIFGFVVERLRVEEKMEWEALDAFMTEAVAMLRIKHEGKG